MANAALGLTNTALDVVAVADKPILRSPLATRSSESCVPRQWRAAFRAYGAVHRHDCVVGPPCTVREALLQPLFHNRHLPNPDGSPLVDACAQRSGGRTFPFTSISDCGFSQRQANA